MGIYQTVGWCNAGWDTEMVGKILVKNVFLGFSFHSSPPLFESLGGVCKGVLEGKFNNNLVLDFRRHRWPWLGKWTLTGAGDVPSFGVMESGGVGFRHPRPAGGRCTWELIGIRVLEQGSMNQNRFGRFLLESMLLSEWGVGEFQFWRKLLNQNSDTIEIKRRDLPG